MLRVAWLVVLLLLAPAARAQKYALGPAPGPLEVGDTGVWTLRDDARDKEVPVRVRYQVATGERAGPFPLVIFSHGAGGSCGAFASLSAYLAGHGYVVVHPTHSDSLQLERGEARREATRRVLTNPRSVVERVDLRDRVADVKFLLDSIDAIEQKIGAPKLIDRDRLAMAGHSAGAMTTQVLGGMEFYLGGRSLGDQLAEPRFDALAVISGQGVNRRGITEDSWDGVSRPWLVITGSRDVSAASDETPESRRHPYEHAQADGTKYLVFIDGATHSSYQGRGPGTLLDGRPPGNLEWIEQTTNLSVLALFDAYVKGDEGAKAWLDAGQSVKREGGEAEFRHK